METFLEMTAGPATIVSDFSLGSVGLVMDLAEIARRLVFELPPFSWLSDWFVMWLLGC